MYCRFTRFSMFSGNPVQFKGKTHERYAMLIGGYCQIVMVTYTSGKLTHSNVDVRQMRVGPSNCSPVTSIPIIGEAGLKKRKR